MEAEPTFIDRELLLPTFVQDLRVLLSQSEDVLSAVADAKLSTGGDFGYRQAAVLRSRFGIPTEEAVTCFRVANYLSHLAGLAEVAPNEAASQIKVAASEIDDPIQVNDGQVEAISSILSSDDMGPLGLAPAVAGSRFLAAVGSWVLRVEKGDGDDGVLTPWVNFNLLWSDLSGARREVSLQVSEEEWGSFHETVARINDARAELAPYLDKPRKRSRTEEAR